ncbi:MAG: ABC transporter permease [Deltaproteobacteria bacterium]|nr:ABC transporter permease [Deltaproteobacteria bacterium]
MRIRFFKLPNFSLRPHTPAFTHLWGWPGRVFLGWLKRRISQAAWAGRIFVLGALSFRGPRVRGSLIRQLILTQILRVFQESFFLMTVLGFLSGFLWSLIWFRVLANIGGSSSLASLLITVQIQEISPFLGAMVIVVTYMGPMTMELSLFKNTKQFETLRLLGVPPIHVLALPRILGPSVTFPLMLIILNCFTLAGNYFGAWFFIDLRYQDFVSSFYQEIKLVNLLKLFFQSMIMSLAMSFFSLYNAWEAQDDNLALTPQIVRRGMMEAFFYASLFGILVTIIYS